MTANAPDLNRLRAIIHDQQRRGEPYPTDATRQITVTRSGGIQVGQPTQPGSAPVSKVQQGTFASESGSRKPKTIEAIAVDLPTMPNSSFLPVLAQDSLPVCGQPSRVTSPASLSAVRDLIAASQQLTNDRPGGHGVRVDRSGAIVVGEQKHDAPAVSSVQQGTFAATRLEKDMLTARSKLPENTAYIDDPDARGWCYSIDTELGETYTLFAYFTGTDYQVRLISPELEGRFNPHGAHLYHDGRLCLSNDPGTGQPTLEEAYSKSVLWALGMSFVKLGERFPWSINNIND